MTQFRSNVTELDSPHHVDISIARWLMLNRSVADAARYLRQFGWSLDSARCILLRGRGIAHKH